MPIATPAAKKLTWVIVAPAMGAAEALTAVAVPTVAVELLAGAVSETEVAATEVTVTAVDVPEFPAESRTRAVIEKLVAVVGVHAIE